MCELMKEAMSRNDEMTERRVMDRRDASPAAPTVPTDLSARLRKYAAGHYDGGIEYPKVMTDAADEIDRLAAAQPLAASAVPAGWVDEFGNVFPVGAYTIDGKLSWSNAHKRGWKPLYASPTPAATMPDGQAVAAWQPIETAPRDGTVVLLWLGAPWCEVRMAKWFAPWGNWQDPESSVDPARDEYCGIGMNLPTHWQPLPAAPAQQPASSEASE